MLTLRDLIQQHMDRSGESRRALGARSGLAHQTLGYWWDGTIKTFPDPETLQAFADATHTSVQTVLLAAARTVGLSIGAAPELAAMLPPGTDNLTQRDRDAILAVIRALVEARRPVSPPPVSGVPQPDYEQGLRLEETSPNLRVVEGTNGADGT